MPSAVPGLITWLVNAFQTAPALGAATPPIAIYDGPVTTNADDKNVLWVGFTDPDATTIEPAATFEQTRDDLGRLTRGEVSSIRCAAEAWTGVDDPATARLQAFAIVTAVETLVRGDATQFGGLAALASPGVTGGELLQNNTQQGAVARVTFSIDFKSFT